MPQQNGQAQATQAVKSEGTEDKSKDNEGYDDTKISEEDEKATLYQETGRITTNPKGSSSYVVINLGLNFIPREKEIKEELAKEPDKALTWKKVLAETKDHITTIMGNYSFEDLKQINRDTLKGTLLRDLQPIFKKEKIFLRNVLLQEFITTD
jgi:flagellar basal body-associated protein FliL